MKVAIVNDNSSISLLMSYTVSDILGHEVIWTADSGEQAMEYAAANTPDLILMDLIMPGMNGAQTTRQIMQDHPCAILVATASVTENASLVFEAMSYGALDAINTMLLCDQSEESVEIIRKKLSNIEKLLHSPAGKSESNGKASAGNHTLIAIGASTGGPGAVATVLKDLPDNLNASIVIVQHVDSEFSDGLSHWLDSQTGLQVVKAAPGERPETGKVYLSATDDHLVLDSEGKFQHTSNPANLFYRPSVNVFYQSAAKNWSGSMIAVLLTGMGADGAEGMKLLQSQGVFTIAQDETTSAVFGMPKAAIEIGAADVVKPIDEIAKCLCDQLVHIELHKKSTGVV